MNDLTSEEIIKQLELKPLPDEGGFFKRSYISNITSKGILSQSPPRSVGSAIYFLLTAAKGGISLFHRLDADEIYHFYGGGTAELHLFSSPGQDSNLNAYQKIILGNKLLEGEVCQFVVPAGTIQGLVPSPGVSWVLLGTTMAPAYEDCGFELIDREMLYSSYPDQKEIIQKFY